MTTTVDTLVPSTFYVPGLNFRGQVADGEFSIFAHNANGAVQLSWPIGEAPAPDGGMVTVHSPTPRTGTAVSRVGDCALLGSKCWAIASTSAYVNDFRPALALGDMRLVCALLAQIHDDAFAGTRVTS